MIFSLSWRNLWRNPARTLITSLSVAFAVFLAILMHSFQDGIFGQLVQNVVRFHTGYLQIHQSGYWSEQIIDNGFQWPDELESKINGTEGIRGVVPRLESFMLGSAGTQTKGCLVIGTVPDLEDQLTSLRSKLRDGTYFHSGDSVALVAEGFAKKLQLKTGDSLVLLGQGLHGSFTACRLRIGGLVHFGNPEQNNSVVYIPLPYFQYLMNGENWITSLVLDVDRPDEMESIQLQLRKKLGNNYECMNWKELLPEISGHIKGDEASGMMFSGILYLIIAFGIFGTLLMMLAERRREFGILISLGMKKQLLSRMLVLEVILLSSLGTLTGIVMSLPIAWYFHFSPIQLGGNFAKAYEQFGFEPIIPTSLNPAIFLTQAAFVFTIALLLACYPWWHIHTLDPMKAFRSK